MISYIFVAGLFGYLLWRFETKDLRARELAVLTTMTAICVVCNELCAHTIPLHAGTAIVVLCGIALGPQAGFFIGATSRFVCNLFDGQGPWSPWQMLSWGLLGLLGGIVFNRVAVRKKYQEEKQTLAKRLSLQKEKSFRVLSLPFIVMIFCLLAAYLSYVVFHETGERFLGWRLYAFGMIGLVLGAILQRKRLPADEITTTVFTFVVVFVVYGGIMNFASMIMTYMTDPTAGISIDVLKALYVTGVAYDFSHAATAAFCVFVAGDSILQKLERIQVKYGIRIR